MTPATSNSKSFVIIGAGGHARVVVDALAALHHQVAGHIAPDASDDSRFGPHLGKDGDLMTLQIGDNLALGLGFVDAKGAKHRANVLKQLDGYSLQTIVHPRSYLSSVASLGDGVFVAANATIGPDTAVGKGSIINTASVVEHDCIIGENCHVATGARLAGEVQLGDNCLIGLGASIKQGVAIGSNAVIGAGAVVLEDVAADTTSLGVPAKIQMAP